MGHTFSESESAICLASNLAETCARKKSPPDKRMIFSVETWIANRSIKINEISLRSAYMQILFIEKII